MAGEGPSLVSRIADKLVRTDDGHLLWTGGLRPDGYGVVWFEGRQWRVHRLTYERKYGPIPEGIELHHREECPKNCAEPDHMTPLTKAEHTIITHKGKNYPTCRSGHSRTGARIRLGPEGQIWFACRECKKRGRKVHGNR